MVVYLYIYTAMSTSRQYYKADPKAPRFTKPAYNILSDKESDFHKNLKKQHCELKKYRRDVINKCIVLFNQRIAQEVIDNRNGIRLPDGLGIIVAGVCGISKETASKNINWHELQKTGVAVSFQNRETDAQIIKVKYSNVLDKHMFDNRHMWCFDADRPFTRALSAEFRKPDGWKKYIKFTTRQHIGHLFRKNKIKNTRKKEYLKKQNLEAYDEFAF
jgi:hypothetical protein